MKWDPLNDENIVGNPNNTLFLGRLHYDIVEDDLQEIFSKFGKIKQVKIVKDKKTNKSRGYAFIEYFNNSDKKAAIRNGNGMKIKGRRIICDKERGRLDSDWKPRRLGGGLGGWKIPITESKIQPTNRRREFRGGHSHGGDGRSSYRNNRGNRNYSGGNGHSGGGSSGRSYFRSDRNGRGNRYGFNRRDDRSKNNYNPYRRSTNDNNGEGRDSRNKYYDEFNNSRRRKRD